MKECEDCFSKIKKLHTSHEHNDKIIWYKPKTVTTITIKTDKENRFDTDDVSFLSLSNQGILVQTTIGGIKRMNPFPLNYIKDIEVE